MMELTDAEIDELRASILAMVHDLLDDEQIPKAVGKINQLCAKAKENIAIAPILTRLDLIGELTSPEYISRLRGVMGEAVEPVAWRREWDGDESDLNHWIYEDDREQLDEPIANWQPLYASPVAGEVKG